MNDKDPHKRMRRFGELCGYFYGRRFFGLDSIMSDKDSNHLILELQEARHLADSNQRAFMQANARCVELMNEVEKLRDLLRWRDSKNELPIGKADYLVQYLEFSGGGFARMVVYWDGSWPPYFPNCKSCYWRPIGPLPLLNMPVFSKESVAMYECKCGAIKNTNEPCLNCGPLPGGE